MKILEFCNKKRATWRSFNGKYRNMVKYNKLFNFWCS